MNELPLTPELVDAFEKTASAYGIPLEQMNEQETAQAYGLFLQDLHEEQEKQAEAVNAQIADAKALGAWMYRGFQEESIKQASAEVDAIMPEFLEVDYAVASAGDVSKLASFGYEIVEDHGNVKVLQKTAEADADKADEAKGFFGKMKDKAGKAKTWAGDQGRSYGKHMRGSDVTLDGEGTMDKLKHYGKLLRGSEGMNADAVSAARKSFGARAGTAAGLSAAAYGGKKMYDNRKSSTEKKADVFDAMVIERRQQFIDFGKEASYDGSVIDNVALQLLADEGWDITPVTGQ